MEDKNIRKRNSIKLPSDNTSSIKQDSPKKSFQNLKSTNSKIPLRIFARVIVIVSLMIIVYISQNHEKQRTFAKQSQVLAGKGQVVECSAEYLKDMNKYEGCIPKECKRYITDQIVSAREADDLLLIGKKGLELGRSSGGASILDLHSGALSKGEHFVNIYKLPEAKGLFTENDFNLYRVVKEKIKYSVAHHFSVDPTKVYLTHPTFFTEITSKKAVTVHDEYWHPHVDKETYQSFHYTTLLYLGDYNIDFRGGRFIFVDEKVNNTVEPRKGRVSMFTSGSENLHYVEKVSSGVRYAITISFTCNPQYAIEDPNTNKFN